MPSRHQVRGARGRAAQHGPNLLASTLARPVHHVAFSRMRDLVADDGGQRVGRVRDSSRFR